jgi:hypothetical protein
MAQKDKLLQERCDKSERTPTRANNPIRMFFDYNAGMDVALSYAGLLMRNRLPEL